MPPVCGSIVMPTGVAVGKTGVTGARSESEDGCDGMLLVYIYPLINALVTWVGARLDRWGDLTLSADNRAS